MNGILKKIDDFFCSYLGLENEIVSPSTIKITSGRIMVSITESFKRHIFTQHWEDFKTINFNQVTDLNKERLGLAIGKAIAKNLVISFEKVKIISDTADA